jgi:hypothetical protein
MSNISTPPSTYDEPPPNIVNYNDLWIKGHVFVPEGRSWPDGMYTRNMAWAFTQLSRDRKDIEGRFCKVFPGVKWVKAMYYRQLDAFIGSTVTEIDQCRKLE